jgi:hypothetical protein
MNPRFMGERVTAHDRLVGLREHADFVGEQPAGAHDFARIHLAVEWHDLRPHARRHDDLFERRVAGPLADPVDGAFDLSRAGLDGGE